MEGREREGPSYRTVEPGPLVTLLRHWPLLRSDAWSSVPLDEGASSLKSSPWQVVGVAVAYRSVVEYGGGSGAVRSSGSGHQTVSNYTLSSMISKHSTVPVPDSLYRRLE